MPALRHASLMIEWSPGSFEAVDLQYNPTELTLEKSVTLAEIGIPGLTAPLQQFVRGQAETLHLELFFDTSDQGTGVDATSVTTLTDKIYGLTRIVPDQHAPPIVTFIWGEDFPGHQLPSELGNQRRNSFTGVVASVKQTFTLWSSTGLPLRAKLTVTIKEYIPLDDQLKALNLASPSKTHSYVLARGDTLGLLADRFYFAAGEWREIALANGIDDPRRLTPGRQLTIPSLPSNR